MPTLDQVPNETLAKLVVRSVYESDGNSPGGTEVLSVANVQLGTPPGGWSCTAVIDGADGQQTLLVTYDVTEGYSDVVQGAEVVEDGGDGDRSDAAEDEELLLLAAKSIYGGFDNWEVRGVRNLQVGTPEGGLTVEVVILSDEGEVLRLGCTWDGEEWKDRLLSEDKSGGRRADAPAKGKKRTTAPKCKTGRPCGKSCIPMKTRSGNPTQCRNNPTGAVKQALNTVATPKKAPKAKAAAGGNATPTPPAAPPLNPAQQIRSILGSGGTGIKMAASVGRLSDDDIGQLVQAANKIYLDAQKLAPDKSTFYQGIAAGNATPDDWILKQLNQLTGYDGKPQQVTKGVIDSAYNNGQYVGYRAMGSSPARFNQHFDNFKNGDFYAGHGIYGHGTYVAYAVQGGMWGKGVAHAAAAPYGSGMMRLALASDAKVVDSRDLQYEVQAVDAALKTWYRSSGDKEGYRRARAVLIGDSGSDISARLATLKGYDAITLTGVAYDDTYMTLLNRSKTLVQKTKGSKTQP